MSSPTPPGKDSKELSNEVRMVIAFVLMGLILVVVVVIGKLLCLLRLQVRGASLEQP